MGNNKIEVTAPQAGVFLVDKPEGLTSFAVVARIRRILGMKKVGHAGTLDPFATGLLVVCAGRPATKMIPMFMEGEKEYFATLRLGVETETFDTEGKVTKRTEVGILNASDIEASLQRFMGVQMQTPPAYSALKHKGKPLYYYARRGIEVKKEPREITVSILERIGEDEDLTGSEMDLRIRVVCSKGTYIRSLAVDIGRDLGCGAHLVQLRRVRSGCFSVEGSLTPEDLTADDARKRFYRKMLSLEEVSKLLQYSNDLDTV
ncbi:tRNA pseudouridine(55) synthase TruB [Desulfomarina sp.]